MSILNHFDIRAISAGVLRLIANPILLEKYYKYLFPVRNLVFHNDDSDDPKSLRLIIKNLEDYRNALGIGKLTFESFESYSSKNMGEMEVEIREKYQAFYSLMKSDVKRMNDEGVFDNFLNYLKILQIAKFSRDLMESYSRGDPDKAVEEMNKVVSRITQITPENLKEFEPKKILEKLKAEKPWMETCLTLGGSNLDQRLGGFKPKTLNLFVGLTNSGKSQMAYHLLRRCIEHKFHAHITIVEDTEETFVERIIACLTDTRIDVIKNPQAWPNDLEDKIKQAQQLIEEYITVDFVYGQSIDSIHRRKMEVDLKRKMDNLPAIKVDIVDYTAHVAGKSWGDKKYDKMLTAYTARKDFALSGNKIVFDFAQVNRDGSKKSSLEEGVLTISELAGSFDISHVCDTIISLNRTETDVSRNQTRLHICKSRNGEKGGTFTYGVDFAKARCLIHEGCFENMDLGKNKSQAQAIINRGGNFRSEEEEKYIER